MFIVPYITIKVNACTQVWLFLERNGTHLIEAGDAHAFSVENGFSDNPTFRTVGDILYLEVDRSTPGLENFYYWEEVAPGTIPAKELWRPFMWLPGTEHLLADIHLSANHTVLTVLQGILSRNTI
jgi:hypothetical protein